MNRRVFSAAVPGVIIAALPGCARTEPGRAVLEESVAALRAVENGTYRFDYAGTGSLTGRYTGRVSFQKPEGGFFFKVELVPSPTRPDPNRDDPDDPPTMTIASNGFEVTVRDEAIGRFSHGTYRGGSGHLAANAGYGLLFQFAEDSPYAIELAGELRHAGRDTIGGVAVDVVEATSPQLGGSTVTWYIGAMDRLPRGRDWVAEGDESSGAFRFRIEELEVDTRLTPDALGNMSDLGDEIVDEDARVVAVGAPAPDGTIDLPGGPAALSSLRGETVVLQIWASWCRSCRDTITELHEAVGGLEGVRLIGLNAWESDTVDPVRWIERLGVSHEVALGGERLAAEFKVPAPPAVFVIAPDGTLVYVSPAGTPPPVLAEQVEAAVRSAIE